MNAVHNEYVIETHALSRMYGRKCALDHLDLAIPCGNIHAIVGANGAGKSTLFRILLGFQSPSSGSAHILVERFAAGSMLRSSAGRSAVGVMA